ncbi:hypothetical protein D3C75_344480 [compost metagenome]
MEVTAGQLIGFGDFHHILHALHLAQVLGKTRCNTADQPDYCMVCAAGQVNLQPLLFNNGNNIIYLLLRCLIRRNNDHIIAPLLGYYD